MSILTRKTSISVKWPERLPFGLSGLLRRDDAGITARFTLHRSRRLAERCEELRAVGPALSQPKHIRGDVPVVDEYEDVQCRKVLRFRFQELIYCSIA